MDHSNKSGDEKDLEISRLRRENEDLLKSKKTLSEKTLEYQSTNERLRRDKSQLEDEKNELKNKIEMMEQLSKSAAMVLNQNDFEDMDGNNNNLGGGLGEL